MHGETVKFIGIDFNIILLPFCTSKKFLTIFLNIRTTLQSHSSSKGAGMAGSMTSQPFPPPPHSQPHQPINMQIYANDLLNMKIYANDLLNMQIAYLICKLYANDLINTQMT